MIYTIHENLVLIKNRLDYLQDNIFTCFFFKNNNRIVFNLILS